MSIRLECLGLCVRAREAPPRLAEESKSIVNMADPKRALLEEAVIHLEKAVSLVGDNHRYQAALGKALLLLGAPDRARGPLLTSFQTGAPPQVSYLLGVASMELKELEEAENYASTAIEQSPGFGRAHTLRACCREERGDREGAIYDYRAAISLGVASPEARLHLALLLLEEVPGLCPGADALREVGEVLAEGSFGSLASIQLYLDGCRLYGEGRYSDAYGCFGRSTALPPPKAGLWKGACLLMQGRDAAATNDLVLAESDPQLASSVELLRTQGARIGVWPLALGLSTLPRVPLLRAVPDRGGQTAETLPPTVGPRTELSPAGSIPATVCDFDPSAGSRDPEGTRISPSSPVGARPKETELMPPPPSFPRTPRRVELHDDFPSTPKRTELSPSAKEMAEVPETEVDPSSPLPEGTLLMPPADDWSVEIEEETRPDGTSLMPPLGPRTEGRPPSSGEADLREAGQ